MKNKPMKYVILVGDGMGDLPIAALNNQTPLEAAIIPTMDYLAGHGELCRLQTIPQGFPPGSDVANLSLLGYLPDKYYTGRAPLEAASMGISLNDDEIAFRCNLVTLDFRNDDRVFMVDYSGGHISTNEAKVLIESLDKESGNEQLHLFPGVSYRHLLVHKGELPGLETVPPHDYTGRDVTEFWRRYQQIPHIKTLLSKACDLLASHEINKKRRNNGQKPANAIWLWGEGKAPAMPTLEERYGVTGALISAVDLLKGIGVYAGMEIINVPGATGYLDTNYTGKAKAALDALQNHDLVFVHVEAPDEASHQGLLPEKIQAIVDFDQLIVKPIFEGLQNSAFDFRLVLAMDHFTPVSLKTHTDQPVPVVFYDSRESGTAGDSTYNEKSAATARFIDDGEQFMKKILF